jgi:NAD(P)-dependent dehydrogenase (short-subunit alcohol dehydrogenase family)
MNYDLNNKVALVTGGSRGLGAAFSTTLADSGAKVAINYFVRSEEAKALQATITEKGGIAEIFQADVTDESQVQQLCEAVTKTLGPIDILVLNATLIRKINTAGLSTLVQRYLKEASLDSVVMYRQKVRNWD